MWTFPYAPLPMVLELSISKSAKRILESKASSYMIDSLSSGVSFALMIVPSAHCSLPYLMKGVDLSRRLRSLASNLLKSRLRARVLGLDVEVKAGVVLVLAASKLAMAPIARCGLKPESWARF